MAIRYSVEVGVEEVETAPVLATRREPEDLEDVLVVDRDLIEGREPVKRTPEGGGRGGCC